MNSTNSMKFSTSLVIALALVAGLAKAQPPGGKRANIDRAKSDRAKSDRATLARPSPLEEVLDADRDGTISDNEIANAAVALMSLDVNKDGKLSADEIRSLPASGEASSSGRGPGAAASGRAAPGAAAEGARGGPSENQGDGRPNRAPGFGGTGGARGFGGPGGPGGFGTPGESPAGKDRPSSGGAAAGPGLPGAGGAGGLGGGSGRVLDPVLRIMQADTDNDGKLSGDEIPEAMRQGLSRIDENGNGVVEREEIESMIQILGLGRPKDGGREAQVPGKDSGRPPRANRAR